MKALIAGGIMVGGVVMAITGGIDLGRMSAQPFDYGNATKPERTDFLKSESDAIGKYIRIGLVSPSGVGTTMRLAETKLSTSRREIKYIIKVQGQMAPSHVFKKARDTMLKKACPRYAKSKLGKNNVKLVQSFVGKGNRSLGTVTISNSTCSRFI